MRKQQAIAAKNRRLQIRKNCRLIDNQISVNLSKLDELMKAIRSKKVEKKLYTIKQTSQQSASEDIQPQPHTTPPQDGKTSLHLKFKYSVQRQYLFDQTSDRCQVTLEREFQTNRKYRLEQKEVVREETQQYPSTSEFTPSPSKREEEDIMLLSENSSNRLQNKESGNQEELKVRKEMKGKGRYPLYRRQGEIYSVRVQTRYDWISSYLDTSLNDTAVRGLTVEGEEVHVISFNQYLNHFQCQSNRPKQQPQQKIIQHKRFQITHKNSPFSLLQQQKINFNYRDFMNYNPQVQVQFYKHNLTVDIIQSDKLQVVKLDLTNAKQRLRVLVKSQNQNINHMQRIMIFKKLPSTNPNDEKHQIVWSKYDKMPFVSDAILQGESSYLIANMCCNPSSIVSLIFNSKDIQYVKIQKSNYDPWKSYNILCSSFQQCSKVFMSQNVFDGTKPLEFLRSNFLDFGLVLEIYQNIYAEKVAFLNNKQKNENQKEDIQLLFPEIYTTQQNNNVYRPKQLVIKFFQVTEKPARLYFPQKRVLVGSKIAQNITIYSTFK